MEKINVKIQFVIRFDYELFYCVFQPPVFRNLRSQIYCSIEIFLSSSSFIIKKNHILTMIHSIVEEDR